MNIEIATAHSVLVELSADDLCAWGLSFDSMDWENARARNVLRWILCEIRAKTNCGFATQTTQVDLLPARNGGCLLIVSSADEEPAEQRADVCALENIDALLDCLAWLHTGKPGLNRSELFRREGVYFLIVFGADDERCNRLREFGTLQRITPYQLELLREASVPLKVPCGT